MTPPYLPSSLIFIDLCHLCVFFFSQNEGSVPCVWSFLVTFCLSQSLWEPRWFMWEDKRRWEPHTMTKVLDGFTQHFDSTFHGSLLLSKVLTAMGFKACNFCLKRAFFLLMCHIFLSELSLCLSTSVGQLWRCGKQKPLSRSLNNSTDHHDEILLFVFFLIISQLSKLISFLKGWTVSSS